MPTQNLGDAMVKKGEFAFGALLFIGGLIELWMLLPPFLQYNTLARQKPLR